MIIKSIKLSGFQNIFEGVKESFSSGRTGFGNALFDYLNHAMISIEIEDLSSMEVFYMMKFATKVHILDSTYKNFVNKENDPGIYNDVEALLNIHNIILKDSDIDTKVNNPDTILPIGCKRYYIIAIFKGAMIANITGSMIQNIFKDPKDNKMDSFYIGNMLMEKRVGDKFISSFYSYMSNQMSDFDLVTSYMNTKRFYQYADNLISCAEVFSPQGEITFFANTSANMTKQIQDLKESISKNANIIEDSIYITFAAKTTISTFLKWYFYTPYVIDHENLKITFVSKAANVTDPIKEKYYNRIGTNFVSLNEHRDGMSESQEIDLNKFNYIFGGNIISYSLQLTMAEAQDLSSVILQDSDLEVVQMRNIINQINKVVISQFS